jgi:hypothetical protein
MRTMRRCGDADDADDAGAGDDAGGAAMRHRAAR